MRKNQVSSASCRRTRPVIQLIERVEGSEFSRRKRRLTLRPILHRHRLLQLRHLLLTQPSVLSEKHNLLEKWRLLPDLIRREEDILKMLKGGLRVAGELGRVEVLN
jgi:hypothetical protein